MNPIAPQIRQFIQEHRFDSPQQLALQLSGKKTDAGFAFILDQISGRQAMKEKIPSWYELDDLVYPPSLSLEQASSEATAQYKASLVHGRSLVDLTGGFGVDCAFLSGSFDSVVYVEEQAALCEIASLNFSTLGKNNIRILCRDAVSYLQQAHPVDCIYLDPARRSKTGQKTVSIADCVPDAGSIRSLLLEKSGTLMIKLSPMLDISSALQTFPETKSVHVISVKNECKELVFLIEKGYQGEAEIHCVNLHSSMGNPFFSFFKSEEKSLHIAYTAEVAHFLYEPNTSLLKAGAYKSVAIQYGLRKLHPDSHLYTSEQYIPDFPGRIFQVVFVSSFNTAELKNHCKGINSANISVRNFPGTSEQLKKRLQLKDGGSLYLFATTLDNGKRVIIAGNKKQI